jgi:hypothetical protein
MLERATPHLLIGRPAELGTPQANGADRFSGDPSIRPLIRCPGAPSGRSLRSEGAAPICRDSDNLAQGLQTQ